ncbi:MAG TPA: hypothetical protein PLU22_08550 [Polyangiaceae bacterium]|nr:hypothetical protein [Polyangiaceae bacterium]
MPALQDPAVRSLALERGERLAWRHAVWFVAAVTLAGCGGKTTADRDGGGQPGPESGGTSAAAEVAALAPALCGYLERCLGEVTWDFGGPDCLSWVEFGLAEGVLPAFAAAVDEGRLAYSPALAATCVETTEQRACTFPIELFVSSHLFCDGIFSGAAAEGESCGLLAECRSGLFCALGESCPGRCEPKATLGEPCESDAHCVAGLFCHPVDRLCVEPVAIGGSCTTWDRCVGGAFCDDDSGTCTGATASFSAPAGAPCSEASGVLCALGLRCVADPDAGRSGSAHCTSELFTPEAACRYGYPDACPDGYRCDIPEDALEGSCRALPGEGEPCMSTWPRACAAGLLCDAGWCRVPAHLGEPCAGSGQCYSGACAGSLCVPATECAV